MGIYIKRGNSIFADMRRDEYVDKSELILFINNTIRTKQRLTCVSRARRFGKSMAAQMLYAYYDKWCDSRQLFEDLNVANPENPANMKPGTAFETHLNKYPVIYIDITNFTTVYHGREDIVKIVASKVKKEIIQEYIQLGLDPDDGLMDILTTITEETGEQFVLIIDEWDALCRELSDKPQLVDEYVCLLRSLFKGSNTDRVFAAVYMTGILPIKQYGTQSALNNFKAYTMTNPGPLAGYFGFTRDEVRMLCKKYDMPYQEMEKWYDGYNMGTTCHIFNPTSVMLALQMHQFDNYWSRTSSFSYLLGLINMDFEGTKEKIMSLLQGDKARIAVERYGDDGGQLSSADELFMLLAHYGYFSFDNHTHEIAIPNQEIRHELLNVVRVGNRKELVQLINDSDTLLAGTLAMDEQYVAEAMDKFHSIYTTPRFYNNEQALCGLIRYAYIGAISDYVVLEEVPSGVGFVDVAFIPTHTKAKPAIVIELKYDDVPDTAIKQIKDRRYPERLIPFADNMLLVAITYDKNSKKHSCKIEKVKNG